MPHYKLVYFNARGLAEVLRWVFVYGDIPFTDERVTPEEWPERKKTIPGGKVPALYEDDKVLLQSLAIGRYIATKAGLVPPCPWEAACCDSLIETLKDITSGIFQVMSPEGPEEEKLRQLREKYMPEVVEPVMERLQKRMSGREWFASDKITWADLAIGRVLESVVQYCGEMATKYPAAVAHAQKVQQLPRIKEWRDRRPKTIF